MVATSGGRASLDDWRMPIQFCRRGHERLLMRILSSIYNQFAGVLGN